MGKGCGQQQGRQQTRGGGCGRAGLCWGCDGHLVTWWSLCNSSCLWGRRAAQPAGSPGTPADPHPGHLRVWSFFPLCERRNSMTLSQAGSLRHIGTNPDSHARERPLTGPRAKSTRENQMLPTQRDPTFLACYGPTTSCSTHTITTAFSSNSDLYS